MDSVTSFFSTFKRHFRLPPARDFSNGVFTYRGFPDGSQFGLSSTESRRARRAMNGGMPAHRAASNSSGGNGLMITDLITASRISARPESNSICPVPVLAEPYAAAVLSQREAREIARAGQKVGLRNDCLISIRSLAAGQFTFGGLGVVSSSPHPRRRFFWRSCSPQERLFSNSAGTAD